MKNVTRMCAIAALLLGATVPTGTTAGAAGYDLSNPSSTNCVNKGQVAVAGSAKSYLGVWRVELRRSTGCNTIWARAVRTDGKKCKTGGLNCAQIRVTRVKSDGTTTQTAQRKMPDGTNGVLSLQLIAVSGATYTGTIATFSGTKIGSTATIKF